MAKRTRTGTSTKVTLPETESTQDLDKLIAEKRSADLAQAKQLLAETIARCRELGFAVTPTVQISGDGQIEAGLALKPIQGGP